jgi:hypothetical protein
MKRYQKENSSVLPSVTVGNVVPPKARGQQRGGCNQRDGALLKFNRQITILLFVVVTTAALFFSSVERQRRKHPEQGSLKGQAQR